MEKEGKNFIDFILAAQQKPEMRPGFLEADTPEKLKTFFEKEGFSDITMEDCRKIVVAMKKFPREIKVVPIPYY